MDTEIGLDVKWSINKRIQEMACVKTTPFQQHLAGAITQNAIIAASKTRAFGPCSQTSCHDVCSPRSHRLQEWHTGNKVVVNHTSNGKHCQPSILNLLQLEPVHLFLGLTVQPLRGPSQISRHAIGILEHVSHGDLSFVRPPFLGTGEGDDLHHAAHANGGRDGVRVVALQIGEHGQSDELRSDESDRGKHGHASVLDLGFLEPLDVPHVGPAEGIEAHGSDEAVRVLGVGEEGERFRHLGVEGRGGGRHVRSGRREGGGGANEGGDGGNLHHGGV
mmetsp:Transcript_10993/g.19740  ORF Transcript_10993/g.19740 Transcript_10993/m.19740 type:complete len:276 (-) Transcript_10993:62-889(-)